MRVLVSRRATGFGGHCGADMVVIVDRGAATVG